MPILPRKTSLIKKKYHEKTLSDSALYINWLRILDVSPIFAKYVWLNLSPFDLSQLGLGLLYHILPIDMKPLTIDFDVELPSIEETLQGIWMKFKPVKWEEKYDWLTDFEKFIKENIKEEYQEGLIEYMNKKAIYGKTRYGRSYYDPFIPREMIKSTWARLRLLRTPDDSWLSTMQTIEETLGVTDQTNDHVFNRIMMHYAVQSEAFVLGMAVLGKSKLCKMDGDFAVVPFIDSQKNIHELKFRTLDHIQIGFILGITPLGYGFLLPKESIYKLPEGKKNPPIINLLIEKMRRITAKLSSTVWAYANYNKPEEMTNPYKSERMEQYDMLQWQRRKIEDWVESQIPSEEANPVRIRQYKNAVLQIYGWKAKRHCYDEETEILTEDGWKKYYELRIGEKVATLNRDGVIEYQPFLDLYVYPYRGKMIHIRNNIVDLMVTPEHRLYVARNYWESNLKFELIEAQEIINKGFRLKRDGKWLSSENKAYFELLKVHNPTRKSSVIRIPMKEWLKFFGLWLAEGSCTIANRGKHEYIVSIASYNQKLKEEIFNMLKRWGFNPIRSGKGNIQIYNKQLYSYLSQFGRSNERYIPKEIKNLPKEYLEILFKYMMLGDGYVGRGGDNYVTTSKRLADDLQEIILKIGMTANIRISRYTRTGKPLYEVSILKPVHNQPIIWGKRDAKRYIKLEDYNGIVWCVKTKNGVVYVRRNGKPVWSGNSWGFDAWRLTTDDEFKQWWLNYWASQGLNRQTLEKLFEGARIWMAELRKRKLELGEKVRRRRLRRAFSL